MFRQYVGLAAFAIVAFTASADDNLTPAFPIKVPARLPASVTALQKAMPYVQVVHEILDSVTSREPPAAVLVKRTAAEAQNEWVVHRVKASVWVERTKSNYLGELGVKVSLPCLIEYGFDLSALRPENFRFDPSRRLVVVETPVIRLREPVPLLAEMKVEPRYTGLRGIVLDAESMRRLQQEVLQEDYHSAARDAGHVELAIAQRKARDVLQEFLQQLFRRAEVDVEVIVR